MYRSYKYRIYPNNIQSKFLESHFRATNFIYNFFLDNRIKNFNSGGNASNSFTDSRELTKMKNTETFSWMKTLIDHSIRNPLDNLDKAYKTFFKNKKGFPKFKNKYSNKSFYIPIGNTKNISKNGTVSLVKGFRIKNDKLYISKLKSGIKIVIDRPFQGEEKFCTISQTPTGKFFVSITVDENIPVLPESKNKVGIDLGLKDLAICSNGTIYKNPKHYLKLEKELAYHQRQMSKKTKDSQGYKKEKLIVAKLHEKIKNQRNANLHQVSKEIIDNNQVIITEDLNISGMIKNHCLAKSISTVSWATFVNQLEYKSKFYRRTFQKISPWFPSSKTCSNCGFKLDKLKLSTRSWSCPSCYIQHNRDINAAKNILKEGKRILNIP